ncbi:MAG: ribosomal-protein-alanine acetyltransferase [Alphaproteobacteria bacterium]|nr:MAG: ribosomal-protein-alanine acetyltransferase [Alphaproteobacteria bacterium]
MLSAPGPETAERLANLHAQAFDAPWSVEAFAGLLDQAGLFTMATDEGFILIRAVADEAEILTLAVRPQARRSGLGRALVEAGAVEAARCGAVRLFLEVAEDNAAARALYARTGFVEAGRRAGYYARADGSATDALVLARDLSERLP